MRGFANWVKTLDNPYQLPPPSVPCPFSLEEAQRVSEMLGFGGEIRSHETPEGTIYMPGPTMKRKEGSQKWAT